MPEDQWGRRLSPNSQTEGAAQAEVLALWFRAFLWRHTHSDHPPTHPRLGAASAHSGWGGLFPLREGFGYAVPGGEKCVRARMLTSSLPNGPKPEAV